MRRHGSPILGDQAEPSKQRKKRKSQAEPPEISTVPHPETRSRTREYVAGKSLQRTETPLKESDELLQVHPTKRVRTDLEQRNTKLIKGRMEAQSLESMSRTSRPQISSSRQSRRLVRDGRSHKLSAEPPPARISTNTSPLKHRTSNNPSLEINRRAREGFREAEDFREFHTLLAPFRKGTTRRELTDWVYNEEEQRWRREEKSTGRVIWAPTFDSFL